MLDVRRGGGAPVCICRAGGPGVSPVRARCLGGGRAPRASSTISGQMSDSEEHGKMAYDAYVEAADGEAMT